MTLKGNVALITGAGRGIGKATAVLLAGMGVKVVLCGRDLESLQNASLLARQEGTDVIALSADVRDWAQVKGMSEKALARCGKIDFLINNAGVASYEPILETSEEAWDWIIDTNLKGIFLCCKAVLPAMLKARKGVIVNISSILGLSGAANMSTYSASKFGVIGFTESLAAEVGPMGIKTYAVCPGPTNTDLHRRIVGREAAETAMSPERVAKEIVGLLSGENTVPSGAAIVVEEEGVSVSNIPPRKTRKRSLRAFIRSLVRGG